MFWKEFMVRGYGGEAPGKIFTVGNPYLAEKGGQAYVKCSRNLTVLRFMISSACFLTHNSDVWSSKHLHDRHRLTLDWPQCTGFSKYA